MTPERWQQVRELLDEAMQLDPPKQSVFLDRCCSHDVSLRAQVEDLLAAAQQVRTGFLESTQLEQPTCRLPVSAATAESKPAGHFTD